MNIRQLQLFKHLAGSLHFGRTSRACNVTPSALTRSVQRMENDIGQQLFARDNRSVSLTDAGVLFLQYADDVLQRWYDFQNELSKDGDLQGEISLYCSVTAAQSLLPSVLVKFRKVYPLVHINLETGDAAQSLTKLQNNEVDLTIAALPSRMAANIKFMRLLETPLVFIAPLRFFDIVMQQENQIDWQNAPIILAERGLSRKRVDRWFAEKKIVPNIYAQVAGNEAIIAMVALGCGIGLVPQLVLDKSPMQEEITVLDVKPELAPFSIGICTMEKNMANSNTAAFWKVASEELQK